MTTLRWFAPVCVMACGCAGPPDPPSEPVDSRSIVERLASDELEGRLTGTDGSRRAAEYIIDRLEDLDATPLPVYALGGIQPAHLSEIARCGARGVAGITMFEHETTLSELMSCLR